ncbi:hypothetical protein [Nannocystis sp. SCPEA4]|uniref:hypothetical protein n=1 Tax=Nannocystis sp. SCPEA4 TaxID=2996787 RepID=UPI00226F284A|nr:hypothetical protein [Nannocystis sp. SCPEA4]MCY1059489.1 hypothetical protein [Nannocystis sp. SCPEA4]
MKRVCTALAATLAVLACESGKPASVGAHTTSSSGASETGNAETGAPPPETTETGGTTEPATTGGTTGETTCNFICETTGEVNSEGPQCDNWGQDCPMGQKCAAYAEGDSLAWNSLKCVPVQENGGQPGDPCTVEGGGVSGIDSCAFGSMCWNVDSETSQGMCVALCTGSPGAPECLDPSTACVIINDGMLNLCLPQCDPLLQNCASSDLCLLSPSDANAFICALDASGDTGAVFDPCEFANSCGKGLVCQDPGFAAECDPQAAGCCLPYCDTTAPDCPGKDQICMPWYDPGAVPPGYENLGLCARPWG